MLAQFAFLFAAVAAVVSGSVLVSQAECARDYTVVGGDTCDAICAKTGTPTFQLQFVNPDINEACTNLSVGQVLCLGIVDQDCTDVHVVQAGDDCIDIAKAAGISLDTLLANNPNVNSDCTNIHIGEVLCTADSVIYNTEHS
ncbi:hypothetical protein ONZ51_g13493 [Trametes cubensis]|uniref:LysM domain-containing protein n=1 Tax=Trametes cubensis TaxID=1111947 RepID=A0AAD7TGF8_9APHY|nr:hypothetical protein ONZ51_g13493 [Trametes cubensis]